MCRTDLYGRPMNEPLYCKDFVDVWAHQRISIWYISSCVYIQLLNIFTKLLDLSLTFLHVMVLIKRQFVCILISAQMMREGQNVKKQTTNKQREDRKIQPPALQQTSQQVTFSPWKVVLGFLSALQNV